jgi:Protein of unknown function (DUF2752)
VTFTQPVGSRWSRLSAPLASAAVALAATGYLAAVDPNQPGHYPLCPFRYVTGYACPGCGSLRAVHDVATGQPLAALQRNPLTVAAVPFVVVMWLLWIRRAATGSGRRWAAPAWLLWTLLGLVLAFWLLRNMPGFGFLGP